MKPQKSSTPSRSVPVELGERSYSIDLGTGLVELLLGIIKTEREAKHPVVAVVDARLASAQPEFLAEALKGVPYQEVPSGETSKSLVDLGKLLEFFASQQVDRTGLVIVIGGGVTGDLAGFAAATYLRGVRLLQVPTTLLAMVDSSVGGKTGINLTAGKNLAGAFHQPSHVLIDLSLLETLPVREFSAGMAEVIKYGLLGDFALYQGLLALKKPLDPGHPALIDVISTCCAQKAAIVKADERETAGKGGRALLNLGHTFAHAIERVAGYGSYLHGEAVAIGLVLAMELSRRLGKAVDGKEVEQLCALLACYQLPTRLREPLSTADLMDAMRRDKKVRASRLHFILLQKPGEATTDDGVDAALVEQVWREAGGAD